MDEQSPLTKSGKRFNLSVAKQLESTKRTRRKIPAPAPATNKWENRIVGSAMVSPTELLANPYNFRKHPIDQSKYLTSVLSRIGWVQEVVVNKTTGNLIDGHLRVSLALTNNEALVPVKYVSLTEEEEKVVLAAFDYISSLADIDTELLDNLLSEANGNDEIINKMLYELAQDFDLRYDHYTPEYEEQNKLRDSEGSYGLEDDIIVPDTVYPSSNEYGIPDLDINMQATNLPLPCLLWGKLSSRVYMPGTYHFYTFDKHFITIWDDPSVIVRSGVKTIMEVNYSVTEQFPLAVAAYRIYQKRWISRWLQEMGIKVFADLCVSPFYRELNMCGIPKGWNAFSTRAYQSSDTFEEDLLAEFRIAQEISGSKNPLFVVLQGAHSVAKMCAKYGWIHIPEQSDRAKINKVDEYSRSNKREQERINRINKDKEDELEAL